ncbi:hypothetical protein [Sphingorhabdus sp.]|jgi:hypothetical protein|uniref:hypothetical protein n=1 Tax=Sphingorhabdus sp. TaxID=1902408 RepID=UPI0037CAC448
MVFVKTKWGGFHKPPYTEEEQLEIARRTTGAVAYKSHQHRHPPRPKHLSSKKSFKPYGQSPPSAKAVVGSLEKEG